MELSVNLDSLEVWAKVVSDRAALFKRVMPMAMRNLRIAQHRDTLRYAHVHGGSYRPKIPSELPDLILVNCSATQKLPEAMFASSKLEEIRLRDCPSLSRLRLPQTNNHLQTLCLERCPALKTLPKAIAGLRALRPLELLSCDGLEELEAGALGSLKNLRALSVMGYHRLPALPDLKDVSTLESLNLSFCSKLGDVLQIGDGWWKLELLDLAGCSSIRKLSPDRKLNPAACSNLDSLPNEIGELRNLQHLEMGFCIRVRIQQASLINLVSLRRLMLTGCSRLERLSKGLDGLPTLEYLNLLGCRTLDTSKHEKVIHELRPHNAVVHRRARRLADRLHRPAGLSQAIVVPRRPMTTGAHTDQEPIAVPRRPMTTGASTAQQSQPFSDDGFTILFLRPERSGVWD